MTQTEKKMAMVYLPPSDLKPYENNPRINDQAVDLVAKSISEFHFRSPVIIDRDHVIICGHTRVKAAEKLGLDTVPCVVVDDLTPEQIKAYRLADNKVAEAAEWDFQKLEEELRNIDESVLDFTMADFGFTDDFMADGLPDDDVEVQEPDAPEIDPEEPAITKPGDIWQLGNHRLMCGDSTDTEQVDELLCGFKTDLLLIDPPYNVNYEGATDKKLKIKNDKMDGESFREFLTKAFTVAEKNMKPGAAFYIWFAGMEQPNFMAAVENAGLKLNEILIWAKNVFALGHYDYQWQHEPCLYGWKPGAAHYFVDSRKLCTILEDPRPEIEEMKKSELVDLLNSIFDGVETTVLRENKPARNAEHPTMKPVKLFARQIQNSTKRGWRVLDLFGGSGTTILACEQLGRIGYSMELDPKYCDVIVKRWEELTGKKATRL